MAYEGYEVPIALGALGLHTDGPQSQLPPNAAIVANNVSFFQGVVSKSPGTTRYSTTGLGSPIVAGIDWWPTPTQQNMVVATANGKIWLDTGTGTFSGGVSLLVNETQWITVSALPDAGAVTWKWNGVAAAGANNFNDTAAQVQTQIRTITGLSNAIVTGDWYYGFTVVMPGTSTSQPLMTTSANTLTHGGNAVTISFAKIKSGATGLGTMNTDAHFVAGGNEVANNPRRLFIFSNGTSQLCMMTGASTSITGISRPAADWSSTYPTFGLIYQNRLVCFGNGSSPHTIYISTLGDHTDFTTSSTTGSGAAQFPIFPGEGDGLMGGIVFKGALLLFKRPFGMYLFQWNGSDPTNPANVVISRLAESFSMASPHAGTQLLDDLVGGSTAGSIFSQKATNAYGSFEAGDMLLQANVRNYFRQQFDPAGIAKMHAINYGEKTMGMFTGRDIATNPQNQVLMMDMGGTSPRISVETKDQPTCLFTRKDLNYIPRPVYGADDGYVYQMDQSAQSVNGIPYTGEFQTPYMDFSYLDPKLADKVKLFDFLAVTFKPLGQWSFYVDVYVDGAFAQTVTFQMKQTSAVLDSFVLDKDKLGSTTVPITLRQPLKSCVGRTVSFRIYNNNLNQGFTVERLVVSFRESGEQNRAVR